MVEHWDVIQAIPNSPKNDNSMWTELVPSDAPRAADPSPEAVIRDYLHIGLTQNDARGAAGITEIVVGFEDVQLACDAGNPALRCTTMWETRLYAGSYWRHLQLPRVPTNFNIIRACLGDIGSFSRFLR